jgi:biopolymer transport protein ExbD
MSFLFECPQCTERRVIAGAAVGHRVRCPACEALVEITLHTSSDAPLSSPGGATSEAAELPIYTGVAITTPQLQPEWEAKPAAAMPGVPVLAMADDEELEEQVVIRSKPEESEMDMTPMVDVTFQLLIFFMVTASFTMQKSLKIPAPKESTANVSSRTLQDYEEDPEFVTVRIDSFGTYFVSGVKWTDEMECPSEQELLVKLREARSDGGTSGSKMLVVAHGDAEHQRVVTAIDAGLSAGIEDVQLLSVEDDNG